VAVPLWPGSVFGVGHRRTGVNAYRSSDPGRPENRPLAGTICDAKAPNMGQNFENVTCKSGPKGGQFEPLPIFTWSVRRECLLPFIMCSSTNLL
jgi:hypothetical protein